MDTRSVTRPPLPSTRAILAGAHLCDQVSALLLIEPKTTRQAFLGEPVEEVMAMVKWVLKHEGETEFDPERILLAWARKRGRDIGRRRTAGSRNAGAVTGQGACPVPSRKPRSGARRERGFSAPAARALGLLSKP